MKSRACVLTSRAAKDLHAVRLSQSVTCFLQAPLLTVDREDLENAIQGRRVRQARHDGPVKKASLRAGAASLLTNPDVMIFFVMVTLMGFAKGVVDSFLFIFIDELGACASVATRP